MSVIVSEREQRTTPSAIKYLLENEIFVFGSNLAGIHGAGAALYAKTLFGAKQGEHFGMTGRCFAIPTKDKQIQTLPLSEIKRYVEFFIQVTRYMENKNFLVTPIGCGLAGYNPEDIAPMFRPTIGLSNVYLPDSFWEILL